LNSTEDCKKVSSKQTMGTLKLLRGGGKGRKYHKGKDEGDRELRFCYTYSELATCYK